MVLALESPVVPAGECLQASVAAVLSAEAALQDALASSDCILVVAVGADDSVEFATESPFEPAFNPLLGCLLDR